MNKSGFSISRNVSQNSRPSAFDSFISDGPNDHLRKQLKTLKQTNSLLTGQIAKLHQDVAVVRRTNHQFLTEMLRTIKIAIEPTTKQQIHSNIFMNDEESSVYAQYLVDSYTDINDEAKQFDNYFKRMALKTKLYEEQIAETARNIKEETDKTDSELQHLKNQLESVTRTREQRGKENTRLNGRIEELRKELEDVNKNTEEESQKIDKIKNQIDNASAKFSQIKNARKKLQQFDILLNKTLSKDALVESQQKVLTMQDELNKLKQMNIQTELQLLKIREHSKPKHFKTIR